MKKLFTLNVIILFLLILSRFSSSAQIVEPNMEDSVKKAKPVTSETTKSNLNKPLPAKINSTIKVNVVKPIVVKVDSTAYEYDGDKAQSVYFEVGGPGLALTINYDARFGHRRDGFGYRVGAGYFASGGNNVFTIPLQVNYLVGKGRSMLELGGGTTFLNSYGDNKGKTFIFDRVTGFIGTATIGYRYQPEATGLNLRIGFVPIFYDEGIIAAGGISVGYNFK